MDQHVTYHPLADEMPQMYQYYISDEQGTALAARHCESVGMDDVNKQRFLDLLPHFAQPGDYPFDQTHGFSIALAQGFFSPYFYVNDAQLSRLGEAIAPYAQRWQDTLPDWQVADSAQNRVLSQYSSGVFIPAATVAQFMSDAHNVPALTQALATEFPGEKLGVLWSALQTAHSMGVGLLEASGAIEPNASDLPASLSFTNFDNCDDAGLHIYVASQSAPSPMQPPPAQPPPPPAEPPATPAPPPGEPTPAPGEPTPPPGEPILSIPPHLADADVPIPGERLPGTLGLSARLRAKRDLASEQTEEEEDDDEEE
jgi:hypothetical protein